MGVRLAALAVALAATPAGFLQAHQAPSGAFAESGGSAGPLLTAWAALGLQRQAPTPARRSSISRPTKPGS